MKTLEERDGVLFVNPGSASIPKDGSASYAVYEHGRFALKALDGRTLAEGGWDGARKRPLTRAVADGPAAYDSRPRSTV